MTDQNQNQAEPENRIKLMFDVMPKSGEGEPAASNQSPVEGVINPPPAGPIDTPVLTSSDLPPNRPRLAWPHLSVKAVAIGVLILAVMVVAGYFGWRYYKSSAPAGTENIILGKPESGALPVDWLKKYFSKETCDAQEVCGTSADPDSDGLSNAEEYKDGTDPNNSDSDYDGLADGDEVHVFNTDPKMADTDGDGFEDGTEVRNGYSPTVASSDPIAVVEKQIIADNTEKYGMHEPTKTFLNLVVYKATFTATSTPALVISAPKNWPAVVQNDTITLKTASSSDVIVIWQSEPNMTPTDLENDIKAVTEKATKIISSKTQKMGGINFRVIAYLDGNNTNGNPVIHHTLAAFLKNGRIYHTTYSTSQSTMEEGYLAQAIIDSIR